MASRKHGILWSGPAIDDLREIRAYVATDDVAAAKRLADRLRRSVRMLADNPRAGRVVPELDGRGFREVIVPPYRLVYEIRPRQIVVLRVWHGRRTLLTRDVEGAATSVPESGVRR